MHQSHAAENVGRFGELDIVVADNLDAIAPRVEKVEKRAGKRLDPRVGQRLADGILRSNYLRAKVPSLLAG
jgi:hypothetical protein